MSCPCCARELEVGDSKFLCKGCGHAFPVEDGIPRMFWPHEKYDDPEDVTEIVGATIDAKPTVSILTDIETDDGDNNGDDGDQGGGKKVVINV